MPRLHPDFISLIIVGLRGWALLVGCFQCHCSIVCNEHEPSSGDGLFKWIVRLCGHSIIYVAISFLKVLVCLDF